MTIQEVLTAEGYNDQESKELIDNPKHSKLLEKILKQSEEGTTALLKAQELETSIRKFNDETVIPYGAKKDQEAAQARAEAAKYKEYLSSLKAAGYEIPDSYLEAPPEKKVEVAGPKYLEASDLDKQGRAYMSLLSASERARDLLGHGLDIEAEYDDFSKNRRPNEVLRSYIDRKYDLPSKEKVKADAKAAADRKVIEDAAIERYQKEHPQSANPDLRSPSASRFDKQQKRPDEDKNLWQTQQGREKAAKNRQEKYSGLLLQ